MTTGPLRLQDGVRWLQTPDGCVIAADAGIATIHGDRVADLIDRLAPGLNGSYDIDQLTASLPDRHATQVRSLIGGLIARGYVSDTEPPPAIATVAIRGSGPIVKALRIALHTTGIAVVADGADEDIVVREPLGTGPDPASGWGHRDAFVELLPANGQLWIGGRSYGVDLADVGLRLSDRDVQVPAPLPDALIELVAAQVAHRLDGRTRSTRDQAGYALCWHDTVQVTRHRVLPHPSTTGPVVDHEYTSDPVAATATTPPLTVEQFSAFAAGIADDLVGPIGSLDEADYCQVPLPISRTVVADPLGRTGGRLTVYGVGWDFGEARVCCALTGLASYASRCVDDRRFARRAAVPSVIGRRIVAAGDHLGPQTTIPAERCYPVLRGDSDLSGVAAGLSWNQTLSDAAGKLLRQQAVARITSGDGWLTPLDPTGLSDERVRFACRMLQASGVLPDIYLWSASDSDPDAPTPTAVAAVDDVMVAVSVEVSQRTAVRTVLRDCLLKRQAEADLSGDYDAPKVPWPCSLANVARTKPVKIIDDRSADLVAALAAGGPHAVVVLDHDDQLTAAVPFLIKVMPDD